MPVEPRGLSLEGLGELNYLHATLTQPKNDWSGFYEAQSPSMNFALRYQLAFSTYALALMSTWTPAYHRPYQEAMQAAIERMLDVATWGYWRAPEPAAATAAQSGHVAVLLQPHRQLPIGPPSDPVAHDNLQYSGHLSVMIGLYEKVTGDTRYDEPFTLHDPHSGVRYTYTHQDVAERIHAQMQANRFGGVCCEPGMAYVPCNNYAMASNLLYDTLHGTRMSEANEGWLQTVRRKMVLRGPSRRGIFGTAYMKDLKMATPVAFNFTDAWGMAFLIPFDRSLVTELYPKFRAKVERVGRGQACVGSSSLSERMEISDVAINTGFGHILARAMGDGKLATALDRYARAEFDPRWSGSQYSYRGAPRTFYSTALYALSAATQLGGDNFAGLFHADPAKVDQKEPMLSEVQDPSGRAGVYRAEWRPDERSLHVGLRQVGNPATLSQAECVTVGLQVDGLHGSIRVTAAGVELDASHISRAGQGRLNFEVLVPASGVVECVVTEQPA